MVERGTGESLDHVAERAEEVLARWSSYAGHRGLEGRELGLDTEEDERQEEEEEEQVEEEEKEVEVVVVEEEESISSVFESLAALRFGGMRIFGDAGAR
jgi:hypothetical protein